MYTKMNTLRKNIEILVKKRHCCQSTGFKFIGFMYVTAFIVTFTLFIVYNPILDGIMTYPIPIDGSNF